MWQNEKLVWAQIRIRIIMNSAFNHGLRKPRSELIILIIIIIIIINIIIIITIISFVRTF